MTGDTASIYLTAGHPTQEQQLVRKYVPSAQWVGSISSFYLNEWQTGALKGIVRLENLRENWDNEGSLQPSRVTIETAKAFIRSLPYEDLPIPFVVPTSLGGLQLEWNEDRKEIEVEILPDGSLEFLKAEDGRTIDEGPISAERAQGLFKWLRPEVERHKVTGGLLHWFRRLLTAS